jgi:hypothetical protein
VAIETKSLTKAAFLATSSCSMKDITEQEDIVSPNGVLDIWSYVKAVPQQDLGEHVVSDELVERVYRSSDGCFDHVLVVTQQNNVYLVVVIDIVNDRVHGHHLLDLNREYGIYLDGR